MKVKETVVEVRRCAECPLYSYFETMRSEAIQLCLHPKHQIENGIPVSRDTIQCPLIENGPLTIRRAKA